MSCPLGLCRLTFPFPFSLHQSITINKQSIDWWERENGPLRGKRKSKSRYSTSRIPALCGCEAVVTRPAIEWPASWNLLSFFFIYWPVRNLITKWRFALANIKKEERTGWTFPFPQNVIAGGYESPDILWVHGHIFCAVIRRQRHNNLWSGECTENKRKWPWKRKSYAGASTKCPFLCVGLSRVAVHYVQSFGPGQQ